MAEEKIPFTIPQEVVDELSQLAPWKGGKDCKTPKEYIIAYLLAGTPETLFKTGKIQCHGGTRRSFIDLYFLTKAKFPEIEFEEFIKLMFSLFYRRLLKANELDRQIYLMYCPDIHKPVIRTVSYQFQGVNGTEDSEKYGLRCFDEPAFSGNPTLAEAFAIAGVDKYHFVGKSFLNLDE